MGVARTNEQDATQVAIFGSIRHHFSRPLALFVLFVSAYLVQGLVKVSNQAAQLELRFRTEKKPAIWNAGHKSVNWPTFRTARWVWYELS